MRPPVTDAPATQVPLLLDKATQLDAYLKTIPVSKLTKAMCISEKLAGKTHELIAGWTSQQGQQREAIDSFLGDIYSGLQVHTWSKEDRDYANQSLRILSGLYGVLKPLDGIYPYRLEMGYRLPKDAYKNLYDFWGDSIAKTIPEDVGIINVSAVEYSKTITQYVDESRIITPVFLTVSPKTGEPTFVVVHAKIARGAFANWVIKNQIEDSSKLKEFNDIGYIYNAKLSTDRQPVFVCKTFGGLGLSVRLT